MAPIVVEDEDKFKNLVQETFKEIAPSSTSSASFWAKAGRLLHIFVSAQPEALILLIPPVYRRAY
jgi:hypothetical protein